MLSTLKSSLLGDVAVEDVEAGVKRLGEKGGLKMIAFLPQVMGFALLIAMVLVWTSPVPMWTGDVIKEVGELAAMEVQLSEQPKRKFSCSRATGGTCFVSVCAADRGNTTCEVTLGVGVIGWHSCNCQLPKPCAHMDGTCHAHPEESWRQHWREDSEWWVLFALAPVMRSGVTQVFAKALALNHMASVPGPTKKLDYSNDATLQTWEGVRDASDFEHPWQAVFVSIFKAVALHASQPSLFFLPFAVYSAAMGWGQWCCATAVVVNEILYLGVIVAGIRKSPHWLLYAPLSDERHPLDLCKMLDGDNKVGAAWYFCAPALFIVGHSRVSEEHPYVSLAACMFSLLASGCACVAMICGLVGHGVMFPSLLVGYMLSAATAVTLFVAWRFR